MAWLHVLSEHPNNLRHYDGVFSRPSLARRLQLLVRQWAGIAANLVRSLTHPLRDIVAESVAFPERVEVLFISHLVSDKAAADAPDFYYGTLPEQLAAHGVSTLVALHNHIPGKDPVLRRRWTRGGAASRVLLPRWSTLSGEGELIRRARNARRALTDQTASAQSDFDASVTREAAIHAMSGAVLAALRVHRAVSALCERFKPKAMVVTWEGHAWERLAFHAARSVDARIRCVGYQHTVLFPRSHALSRRLGECYDPNLIVTAGDVNRDMLEAKASLRGIPIVTYGSHRREVETMPRSVDSATRCLVIPEGLEPECIALFDLALEAAAEMPDLHFVLRTHPVLPFEHLARRHSRFRSLPANVSVSRTADIMIDFASCDWGLYRGSSAIVHAVLAGVRPVYLRTSAEELSIDPLFALRTWRRCIEGVQDLRNVVASDRALNELQRRIEWEPAREFCDRYFVSPNLQAFVSSVIDQLLTTN